MSDRGGGKRGRPVNPFRSRETFFGETPQGVTDSDREAIRTIR